MIFSSIFRAVQGEGLNAGRSTIFIRLHTEQCFPCGGHCSFCDTIRKNNYQPLFDLNDIRVRLTKMHKKIPITCITITGGEPLSIDLMPLLDLIHELNHMCYVEVETNGSYVFENMYSDMIDHYSISPKLKTAGVDHEYNITKFDGVKHRSTFKFVVSEKNFDEEIIEVNRWRKTLETNNFWIMPLTPSTLEFNQYVFEFCALNGFNYSPRLHISLYGDTEREI